MRKNAPAFKDDAGSAMHVPDHWPAKSAEVSQREALSGASELQSRLNRAFADQELPLPGPQVPPKIEAKPKPWRLRLLKTIAGLAIVAVVGWMPMQRLFQVSSVEAVVNAPVVTLRAPIDGIVAGGPGEMKVGSAVDAGKPLMRIENPRADVQAVERTSVALSDARAERASVDVRLAELQRMRFLVSERVEHYRQDRSRKVAAEIAEAEARMAAATAALDLANLVLSRQTQLTSQGVGSDAAADEARTEVTIARAAFAEASARKAALSVEAEVLREGRFLGDDYNDEPRSAQRLDDLDQSIMEMRAEATKLGARVRTEEDRLRHEQARLELAQGAEMPAPVAGRVWEVMTAPGEQVVAGQPLASLLDCSQMMVTASVSEAVYNTLSVGHAATFKFREGGAPLPGRVAQLSGVAAAASNFAILPSALTKESYRVSIAFDHAAVDGCPVGRTGRVVFRKPSG